MGVFNAESLRAYRQRMRLSRPGHVWDTLDDEDFLIKLGAAGIGEDGKKHPTAAGLLMFGNEYDIVREYPQYFLDYREVYDDTHRWTDRLISSSGDWSGNVFDFYYRVYNRIQLDLKVPFEMEGGYRVDDTPVHKAIREALANCLVNADYYGRQGLVIIKEPGCLRLSNPGCFRIEVAAAKSGGILHLHPIPEPFKQSGPDSPDPLQISDAAEGSLLTGLDNAQRQGIAHTGKCLQFLHGSCIHIDGPCAFSRLSRSGLPFIRQGRFPC